MSELKTRYIDDTYVEYFNTGNHELAQIYLKSEVDMVIDELKVKLRVQTSNAEDAWKLKDSYHSNYAEAVKELYEKNKELRHHKYKRCLAMAKMCKAKYDEEDVRVNGRGASWDYTSEEMKYWERWQKRWQELAEKFKEAK